MPMLGGENFWKREKHWLKLSEILKLRRGSGCKYPCDLVYSLLGAARDCPNIKVDYDQPFEKVFARSTWQIMSQQGGLSILRELERDRRLSDLSTWVPDWRIKMGQGRDLLSVSPTFQYRATGSSRLTAKLSADYKVLSVWGSYCDIIKATHPSEARDLEQWVSAMFDSPEQLQKLYSPTNESLERALRRVWFLDTTAFEGRDEITRWRPDSHDKYEETVNNALSDREEAKINYGKLLHAMVRMRDSRAILVTEGGKLGMAASTIQPGDIIAMLLGGDMPFVLRRVGDSDSYTFVADCYVHGFMDGESFIEAKMAADPAWNPRDKTWLEKLHKDELPFPVKEFRIH